MKITFFGTRGSCPCAGHAYQVFGGNTSCVLVETEGNPRIILDAGTGLRSLGTWLRPQLLSGGKPLFARLLLTHLHYDHLLGLPFFSPLEDPGAVVEVYGPRQQGQDLASTIDGAVTPPFFPVQMKEFRGDVHLIDIGEEVLEFGSTKVTTRFVPHTGTTLGFRIESQGASLAYIPDHQAPLERKGVAESVLELCDNVDLLIHDAQYDEEEFALKSNWGHSTVGYAVNVADQVNAKVLALFHHDPSHDDQRIAELELGAQRQSELLSIQHIFAAREGETIDLLEKKGKV